MKYIFPFSIIMLTASLCTAGIIVVSSLRQQPTQTTVTETVTGEAREDTMVRSASWFSGLYAFPSFPVFAHPGAYRISPTGLEIGLPTITTNEKLIAGAFVPSCTLHAGKPLRTTQVLGYGDFHVRVELSDGTHRWEVTLLQGSPVVSVQGTTPLAMDCVSPQDRILFQTAPTDDSTTVSQRVILLPIRTNTNSPVFQNLPWAKPIGTTVSYGIDPAGEITTTFRVDTESGLDTLLTLWPHHGIRGESMGRYDSVLGSLDLIQANTFTTRTTTPPLPLSFPKVTPPSLVASLRTSIEVDSKRYLKETPPGGVYFKGTWIGGLVSLIQLADLYEETALRDQLLTKLESVLLPTLSEFHYDAEKSLWVANNPEFGNEKGNDHHFHYGYYIRASAILAHFRPERLSILRPTIDEMIADTASIDHNERYARLRVFSPYEGHGWASGDSAFADGNNQESTSEALNAWYAIKIWGDVIQDQSLSDRGSWLFSQELMGTKSYWFGIENPFPAGYNRSLASLVWGGKREFATWFSADPMHIYGIQWLPITPASNYLSNSASRGWIEELGRLGTVPATHEWGDLYTAVLAGVDPKKALELATQIQTTKGMYIHSLLLQTVYANQEK